MADHDLTSAELRELMYRYDLAADRRRLLIKELHGIAAAFRRVREEKPEHAAALQNRATH